MDGRDNLIPVRTKEEARERGTNGGIASGEARRKRKTLREELLALLSVDGTQERVSLALIKEATEGNGSGSVARAFETIRDTVGEKPIDKVMVADVDIGVIEQIEKMVLGKDNDA